MTAVAKFGALLAAGVNMQTAMEITGLRKDGERPIEQMLFAAILTGAPLGQVTQRLVAFEFDLAKFKSELASANAVPIATRKLLLWLPGLSLVIGQLAGFGTIAAIFHPVGLIALVLALLLIAIGVRWSGRLLAPLLKDPTHPALELIQFSLRLSSGASLKESVSPGVSELVLLSRQTGAPLQELVQHEIDLVTQRALQDSMTQAKHMSIELLVPMALTVLPAFLILTIVPMLIGFGL